MHALLDFEFLAILNLFVILLWPAIGAYWPATGDNPRRGKDVVSFIVFILTAIAVVLDIFFLVLRIAVH